MRTQVQPSSTVSKAGSALFLEILNVVVQEEADVTGTAIAKMGRQCDAGDFCKGPGTKSRELHHSTQ